LGDGGIAIVGRATGLSRTTIRAGREELRAGVAADDVVAVWRPGGGRPRHALIHHRVKRDELRAYRVLFHPGSRSHKVLLDNFVLLGS
jgi:hypothetical protein